MYWQWDCSQDRDTSLHEEYTWILDVANFDTHPIKYWHSVIAVKIYDDMATWME